ncbi:MAG: thermonuclease family protein [Thermomicrobiales bacterium]
MARPTSVLTLAILLTSLLLPLAASAADPLPGLPDGTEQARISDYIDGDKIKVKLGGDEFTVNFIGADAPEPGECYANEATRYVKKTLKKNQVVYLEKDSKDKDSKDRLLRYLWTAESSGKKAYLVNQRFIKAGMASFVSKDDNTRYDPRLKKAQADAKAKKAGLWGACSGPHQEVTPVPKVGSGDNPAPLGMPLEADGRRITLNSAYFTESYGFFTPQQNYVFLVIDVSMENISDSGKSHSYNELCFAGKDLDHDSDIDDSALNPSDRPLGAGDMLPGDVVNGEVVLEVHQDTTHVRVKYSTGDAFCSGGKSLYWLVTR